jgi:hypothetical protein
MSTHAAIEKEVTKLRAQIAAARAEAAQFSLALVDAPGDQKVLDELESLERIIEQHERSVARFEAAKTEAQQRDSRKARLQRLALVHMQQERLLQGNTDIEQLAGQIERALDALHPLLAKWDALVADREADAHAITLESGMLEYATSHYIDLSTGEIAEAMARHVAAAGIGSAGPRATLFVNVATPTRMSRWLTLTEAVQLANARFTSLIDKRVAVATARLGFDAAQPTGNQPAAPAVPTSAAPAVNEAHTPAVSSGETLLTGGYVAPSEQPATGDATAESVDGAAPSGVPETDASGTVEKPAEPATDAESPAAPEQAKPRKKRKVSA